MRTSPHGSPGLAKGPEQSSAAGVVEPLIGLGQQPSRSIQRVVFTARWPSVSFRTRRHSSSLLWRAWQMDGSATWTASGGHRFEHQPVWTRQVQRRVFDVRQPGVASGGEPSAGLGDAATGHLVQRAAGADIGDRCRPVLVTAQADPTERRLGEPRRGRFGDPGRRRRARSNKRSRCRLTSVSHSRAPSRLRWPCGQDGRRFGQPRGLLGPRLRRARRVRAGPAALAPQQPGQTPERRQIHGPPQGGECRAMSYREPRCWACRSWW